MSAPSAVQSMTWALAGRLGEGVRDAVPSGPSNVEFQTSRGGLDALFGKRCATCQEARKDTPKTENRVFAIFGAPTRFSSGLYLVLAELREATFFFSSGISRAITSDSTCALSARRRFSRKNV